ncbi:MAG: NeuD/PglB/VioB family sugar acetyltransferase [Bacteroidia bacterium]|nr:NeuD/PglB/VioB family sugar acetyltransferase [Bacteroidia bacterium]MDW8302576.1 NeuD/PglB/VioB family sugar acetyltransferase [Bacteroidia bacterium]
MQPIKVVILGATGNGIDILDTLLDINQSLGTQKYQCLGFLDDKDELQGKTIYADCKVLGKLTHASNFDDEVFFATAIGSARTYLQKSSLLKHISLNRFITVIHPTAYVSRSAVIGTGSVILQNVTVCNNVRIGNQVVILANTVINHDSVIDSFTNIASGVSVSGGVRIGQNCYIGTNVAIKESVTIGEKSLVGMGSNVLADIPANSLVWGNPAKIIDRVAF